LFVAAVGEQLATLSGGFPMLSKCANPDCWARFHFLHEGRIFKIETGAVASDSARSLSRRIEYFWLCERCVQTLTVVLQNGVVTTRPLRRELTQGAPENKSERKRDVA
jgi:hypothetical protein